VDRKRKLFEVVGALHAPSRLASGLDGREQKSHQNTDNGDDDQKFDQGKATPSSGWRNSGGLVGNRCKKSWHEVSLWANRKSLAGLDRRINSVFTNGKYNQLQKIRFAMFLHQRQDGNTKTRTIGCRRRNSVMKNTKPAESPLA
jgi:hypothetical protein